MTRHGAGPFDRSAVAARGARAALAVLVASVAAYPAFGAARLLPEPRRFVPSEGRLVLREGDRIAVTSGDDADRFAAELLRDEIRRAGSVNAAIVSGSSGAIVLSRDPKAAELGEEGYRLTVDPRGARATASTAAGLYYAVQTLRQLVEPQGIGAITVEDAPALRWRGVHDDLSRGPLPTLETLERRIRTAAELKLNVYFLYFETSFTYRAQPLMAPPGGALDSSDVAELVHFASGHHVVLVPEQQTTAHLEGVLRLERYQRLAAVRHGSSITPGNETDAFVASMVDELAPLFPGPWLHLGGDEAAPMRKGGSRAQQAAVGHDSLFVGHLRRLAAQARRYGKRTIVWGDAVVEHPGWASRLPADLAIASWCYDALDDYSRWIHPFTAAKLELFVCPGALNWNRVFPDLDVALPNIRDFVSQGRLSGATGAVTCVWADNGDAPFDLCWYALAAGAPAAWQSAPLDTTRLHDAFDWALLR